MLKNCMILSSGLNFYCRIEAIIVVEVWRRFLIHYYKKEKMSRFVQ